MNLLELIKNNSSIISGAIGGIMATIVCWCLVAIGRFTKKIIHIIYSKNKPRISECKKKLAIFLIELKYISYWFDIIFANIQHKDVEKRTIQFIRSYRENKYEPGILMEGLPYIEINNKAIYRTRKLTKKEINSWNKYFISCGEKTLEEREIEEREKDKEELRKCKEVMQQVINSVPKLMKQRL